MADGTRNNQPRYRKPAAPDARGDTRWETLREEVSQLEADLAALAASIEAQLGAANTVTTQALDIQASITPDHDQLVRAGFVELLARPERRAAAVFGRLDAAQQVLLDLWELVDAVATKTQRKTVLAAEAEAEEAATPL